MARARPFAEKALELDPDLAAAHASMALIRYHGDWDFARAEAGFKHAIDLDPGWVFARQQYSVLLASLGRLDEAIEQMEIAHDLDPFTFDPVGFDLGRLYELTGERDRALAQWKQTLALAPNYFQPHMRLGDYYCRAGQPEKAIPRLSRAIELSSDDPWLVANLGYCYAISGSREDARRTVRELGELSSRGYVTQVGPALIHVGLGEADEAFAALERAYELRALRIKDLKIDPRWDPLRSDPRFQDLLRRIGFPES